MSKRTTSWVALLLAMAWSGTGSAAGGLVPQHSEDLRPAFTRASKGDAATLRFTAFGRDFHLRLSTNQHLARVAAGSSVQLYAGTIEGIPGSWARIGIHEGLPRGMIWDGRELFAVEAGAEGVNYGAAGTVMFKLADAVLEQRVAFMDDAVQKPDDPGVDYHVLLDDLRASTQALQAGAASQGVELSILADASFLARYESEAQARDAILIRLNNVDGIFSAQLGVSLLIDSVSIGSELTASLSATTDGGALLDELGRLRQRTPALSATGLTHLITGRRLGSGNAGIAYTLALCSPRYAASLHAAHGSTALDTLTIAHEIGHVFGAPHDGAGRCASTPQGQHIMTPTIDTSITSFSQCSVHEIREVLPSYSCVVTLPDSGSAPPPDPPRADDSGGDGGSGALDLSLLLLMLGLGALRLTYRARGPCPRPGARNLTSAPS